MPSLAAFAIIGLLGTITCFTLFVSSPFEILHELGA